MNRRFFLRQSSALTAGIASLGWTSLPRIFSNPPTYKLGLQLFTVRDAMAADPEGTLKKLKKMGYEDFEIYGYDSIKDEIYGYPIARFKQLLDQMGLTTTSGHYGFSDYFDATTEELRAFVDQCIHTAKRLESAYITWPWVHPDRRNPEGFSKLADLLNTIGQQVTQAGLGFAYHNHGYEFEDWNGTTGHDILMAKTNSEWVKLQMDLYWVIHSGRTPKELVAAHPGRYVMWHIKDMDKITRDYTELGNGSIDYTAILPDPKIAGLEYYYLEQGGNFAVNSMKSVATSIRYFKKHLAQQF